MRVRSLLSMCSSSIVISGDSSAPSPHGNHSPPPKSLISEATSSTFRSDSQANSSSSSSSSTTTCTNNSNSTIQTNLSLLTLPSVPSLQQFKLSPQNEAVHPLAIAVLLTSLNQTRPAVINFLAAHNNLLYAASGNVVNVYRISDNALFDTFNLEKNSTGAVKSIAFRDGKVFTAHQDCKIRVWKLNSQKQMHTLIATLPTLKDRLRRFILPRNYVEVRRHMKKLWVHHYDVVSALATCQDHDNLVFSTSWDKSVKIWRARDLHCLESINKAHDDAINCVALSNDGLIIYTGSGDKRIKAWNRNGNKYGLIATLEKHKSAVNALALTLDGSVLYSGSSDRSILVWEKEDSENHMAVSGALRGHAKAIHCLINVRDVLLSGSGDRTVRIWRRGFDGRYSCLAVLDGHCTPVKSLTAVEEEKGADGGVVKVFSGSIDGEIRVWQVEVASGIRG